jgi:peptide/nickel transport system substrate-binding protein
MAKHRTSLTFLMLAFSFNLLIGLLSACSDNGSRSPNSTAPAFTAKTSSSDIIINTANSSTNISSITPTVYDPAKTFIFGLAQEPVGLNQVNFDPANLTDRSSLLVTRQIYEGLFTYKPDSMGILYASFIKYLDTSDDGLTYHIRLRKGIVFSDGTPLDASAIKFNFDRWSNEASIYHQGDFATWRTFWGGFPGYLDSVQATDSINLTIKLKAPLASFFQILAMPQFAIVAPSAFDRKGVFQRPIGSGPYRLEQVVRVEPKRMILRVNPRYAVERPDVVSLPTLDPVVVQVLRANQDGLKELRDGHISATNKVRPEDSLQPDPTYHILLRQPLNVTFLVMNQAKPPFNNLNVRRAFAYAINTSAMLNTAFMGLGQQANSLLPPTTLGYESSQPSYTYDPDKARMLLAQAGYTTGNALVVNLWRLPDPRFYYPDTQKVTDAVVQDLAKIGVTVHVQNVDWATFYQDRDDGNLDFYMGGWQGVNGDADEFFSAIITQAQRADGYSNQALLKIIEQGRNLLDLAQRRQYYNQALDAIYQDVPQIPLAFVQEPLALRPNVQGYLLNPTGVDSWASLTLK